jgi:nicotinamide phosphoribosyltransferase
MTISNAVAQTDFYKWFHRAGAIDGVDFMYGNYTSRNGRLSNIKDNKEVTFVGLQYFIKDVLISEWNTTFFKLPKEQVIAEIKRITKYCLFQPDYDTKHFEDLHDLGYLPVHIKALPEGVSVPYGVAPVTFVNTVAGFDWLEGFLETSFSTENWGIQTSATTARAYLKRTMKAFDAAGLPYDLVPFMCHDFSMRGVFGRHAAAMSGFGHLCSFAGTDTIPAILFAEKYYNANMETELVGCSVNATEHSITTTAISVLEKERGISKLEAEVAYIREVLFKAAPTGILSHVSDSFDFWKFVSEGLPMLKEDILSRDGKFVIRPDSGDPVDIICGTGSKAIHFNGSTWVTSEGTFKAAVMEDLDERFRDELSEDPTNPFSEMTETYTYEGKYYKVTYTPDLNRHDKTYYYVDNYGNYESNFTWKEVEVTPESKGLIECLGDLFGTTESPTGLKLLHDNIGAIYGDSITLERQDQIISRLEGKGYAGLVVLGVGSYSYQYVTRDTHGSAVKSTFASGALIGAVDVCKDPKTDSKKKSAKGLLRIELENGTYVQYDQQTPEQEASGELQTVFLDGKLVRETSLAEIRQRVKDSIK